MKPSTPVRCAWNGLERVYAASAMDVTQALDFTLLLPLDEVAALAFVRDLSAGLKGAQLVRQVKIDGAQADLLRGELLVRTGFAADQAVPFASRLLATPCGARLEPLAPAGDGLLCGSLAAEVRLEPHAKVQHASQPQQTPAHYRMEMRLEIRLPDAKRWSTGAMAKMIELTAKAHLAKFSQDVPAALAAAAATYKVPLPLA